MHEQQPARLPSTGLAFIAHVRCCEVRSLTDTATATRTVRRFSVPLGMPYAEAIRRFEDLLPGVDLERFTALEEWDDAVRLAGRTAPLGLMRFWALDVPPLMVGGRALWDCTEYLVANHVIAQQMYRYDPVATVYAPLRFLIYADPPGHTSGRPRRLTGDPVPPSLPVVAGR